MSDDLKSKFTAALDSFVARAEEDKHVLAIILAGSLYHDVVWHKSDIDVILLVDDTKQPFKFVSLVEDGIIINASIYSRHQFKKLFGTSLRSSQFHSWIAKTTLLYTRDETLRELYDDLFDLGDSDRELLLLKHGTIAVADLAKAQKWLYVKDDPLYSYFAVVKMIDTLASIETISHGQIPTREVIHQALSLNPTFFDAIYTDLAQRVKDRALVDGALKRIEEYLKERTASLFRPLLDIIAADGEVIALSEIHTRLATTLNIEMALLLEACEWLVEQGCIERFSASVRLTAKSHVQLDEAAYLSGGGNPQ